MGGFKFISLNCNGLKNHKKRGFIFDYLKSVKYDFCFLQETFCSSRTVAEGWGKELGAKIFYSLGTDDARGVSIFISKSLVCNIHKVTCDQVGRGLSVDVDIRGLKLRLVSVYFPQINCSIQEFDILIQFLKSVCSTSRTVIMAGDFNFVEDLSLDKRTPIPLSRNRGISRVQSFIDFRSFYNLQDPFRTLYPRDMAFSHRQIVSGGVSFSRLDRFYVSSAIVQEISLVSHKFCPHSDHFYVHMETNIFPNKCPSGPGYWKLNVSILEDPEVISSVEKLWTEELYYMSSFHDVYWWDKCKRRFKDILRYHSIKKARERREELNKLETELDFYCRLEKGAFDPGPFTKIISEKRDQILGLLAYKYEGNRIRARVADLEGAEKPSSYFLKQEFGRAKSKQINKLKGENGVIYEDFPSIVSLVRDFYKDLFHKEDIDQDMVDLFLDGVPVLDHSDRSFCEGLLTYDECLEAIKLMKNERSPGSDGLPCEFYKKFFYLFGQSLVKLYNLCFHMGRLSRSQRSCIMTLLCKNFEQDILLAFWRPISLLNVDFKIISKCMSIRMGKVLPSIISIDQTCSVIGRSISDNCHLLRNVVDYINSKPLMGAALINLDFSKAFDRVSHKYLFATLEAFGFGPEFISWLRLLYQDISSSVLLNGFITEAIGVHRGVRQGCPLSPLLYVLSVEPFALAIRRSTYIKGVPLPGGNEVSICQYADDSTILVSSLSSVYKLLDISRRFGQASGAQLNLAKCFCILLGKFRTMGLESLQGIICRPFGKILGIMHGIGNMQQENWERVQGKFKDTIISHRDRKLTLKGKAVIFNSMMASKLWYVGAIKTISKELLRQFNVNLNEFIWQGGMCLIRRPVLELPDYSGGVGLINIELKLKAFLIRHIVQYFVGDFHPWKAFAKYWIELDIWKYDPQITHLSGPHSLDKPEFYKVAVSCFRTFRDSFPLIPFPQLTVKKIYELLLSQRDEKPNIEFQLVGTNRQQFVTYYKSVCAPYVGHLERDIAYKVLHGVLPTLDRLFKYNIVNITTCCLCRVWPESLSHIFISCPVVRDTREFLQSVFFKLCNHRLKLTDKLIRFNFLNIPGLNTASKRLFITLLFIYRRAVWLKRNAGSVRHCSIDSEVLLKFFFWFWLGRDVWPIRSGGQGLNFGDFGA